MLVCRPFDKLDLRDQHGSQSTTALGEVRAEEITQRMLELAHKQSS
jgi:hypothetical protein